MVFVLFKYLLTVKELFLFCHAIFVHSVLTEISLRFPGKSYLKISSSYEIVSEKRNRPKKKYKQCTLKIVVKLSFKNKHSTLKHDTSSLICIHIWK